MQRLNRLKYYVLDTFQTSTNTFLLLVHQPPTINAEFLMAKRTLCKQFIATHNGVTMCSITVFCYSRSNPSAHCSFWFTTSGCRRMFPHIVFSIIKSTIIQYRMKVAIQSALNLWPIDFHIGCSSTDSLNWSYAVLMNSVTVSSRCWPVSLALT